MLSETENPSAGGLRCRGPLLFVVCILLSGCSPGQTSPSIRFSRVPLFDQGGTGKVAAIQGKVSGARPGQQIVLYARSGAWYIQPFTSQPFTVPAFWQTWWFRLTGGATLICALLVFHRLRLRQLTRRLNARFEERLDERMRIAQDLHDTLLQGFLSASMQLHVAVERLPEELQSKLDHVQNLIGQIIEEGRNTVHGLRSISGDLLDLGSAFSRIQPAAGVAFQVSVEGQPVPLHPLLRDEVYRLGREAVVNAASHFRSKNIQVEVEYGNNLRILVRADGQARAGQLSGLRERAEKIGARLKIRSRTGAGCELELFVPGPIAYLNRPPGAGWLSRLSGRRSKKG